MSLVFWLNRSVDPRASTLFSKVPTFFPNVVTFDYNDSTIAFKSATSLIVLLSFLGVSVLLLVLLPLVILLIFWYFSLLYFDFFVFFFLYFYFRFWVDIDVMLWLWEHSIDVFSFLSVVWKLGNHLGLYQRWKGIVWAAFSPVPWEIDGETHAFPICWSIP